MRQTTDETYVPPAFCPLDTYEMAQAMQQSDDADGMLMEWALDSLALDQESPQ